MRDLAVEREPRRRFPLFFVCASLAICAATAHAQDERHVLSPHGDLEFRLYVSPMGSSGLPQIAYQVLHHGRMAIDTSFLGFNVYNQEPMLGENDGLIASHIGPASGPYRSLVADYMQNGSIGRLINIEVRVWDDAVAFRYVIPRSTALDQLLLEDELTEFNVVGDGHPSSLKLPAAVTERGGGWVGISEVPLAGFPRMSPVSDEGNVLTAHLERSPAQSRIAYEGRTPLVCPWRVLTFATDREHAIHPRVLGELSRN